jgi:hypothetical protein
MGIFNWLFGPAPRSPVDDLMASIDRTSTLSSAPEDHALRRLAEERMGDSSPKDVDDEHDRLVFEKYRRRNRRLR